MSQTRASIAVTARRVALNKLGNNIRKLRTRDRLTQEIVAQKVGVSVQTVRNWEVGRSEPKEDKLQHLAELFGTTANTIASGTQETLPNPQSLGTYNRVNVDPKRMLLARQQSGMSQAQVEAQSGVARTNIGRYENGKTQPTPPSLSALASVYRKPPSWFLVQDTPDPTSANSSTDDNTSAGIDYENQRPATMDRAMQTYAIARPDLSDRAIETISDFIAFVHHKEIQRNHLR